MRFWLCLKGWRPKRSDRGLAPRSKRKINLLLRVDRELRKFICTVNDDGASNREKSGKS